MTGTGYLLATTQANSYTSLPSRRLIAAVQGVVLLALATATLGAQERKLGPVSLPASRDLPASFDPFRNELRSAAVACDVARLEQLLAPTVKAGYETTDRRSILEVVCEGGRPWRSLRNSLDQGVFQRAEALVAPSAFALDDDETTAIVVGREVRVRAEPAPGAPVVGRVSLERVRMEASHDFNMSLFDDSDTPESPAAWARVTTSTGVTGYVYGRYLYTVDTTRFVFEFAAGRWALVAWAAGPG